MTDSLWYKGKCDNCGKSHPKIFVKIYKDRGDKVTSKEFWYIHCSRTYQEDSNENRE